MKTWQWIMVAVLIVACIICAGWLGMSSGEVVQAVVVKRAPIQEYVDERGKTRLEKTHRITMPYPGRIEPIDLVEGERVKRNQVVAQVVQTDLDIAIAEARAAVDRYSASIAENQHHEVERRAREQAVEMVTSIAKTAEAAEARLTASKSRLDFATRFRKDAERLFQENAVSETEFERAELEEVESQVQYAEDALTWKSTESLRKAMEMLPQIIDAYVARKEKTRVVLENQKAEAHARLEDMLLRKRRGTMLSPVDGVVLARMVTNERFLAGGSELLTIGELGQLEVEVDVLSLDVGGIDEGDPAIIYGSSVGAEAENGIPGVVKRIYPAGFTKISSLGVEQQRVKVIVGFDQKILKQLLHERSLGVDFRVRVQIITDGKPAALVVPRSALFRGPGGGWQVFAIRGSRAIRQDVNVGLMNDRQVEILDGLSENESVIVAPESSLEHGQRVKQQ